MTQLFSEQAFRANLSHFQAPWMAMTNSSLKPVVDANQGSFAWLADGMPEIRRVGREDRTHGGTFGGTAWIGLRQNGDYVVTGIRELPLMVGFAALLLAMVPLLFAWRREGK